MGKEKPNTSDFAQLHWPAAEFVLHFVHCYWPILKGVCGDVGLVLKLGVESPCLSPPAPEREFSVCPEQQPLYPKNVHSEKQMGGGGLAAGRVGGRGRD